MEIPWTIQAVRGNVVDSKQEFATKRQAVVAMQMQREPKTPIMRLNRGRDYVFTPKKKV